MSAASASASASAILGADLFASLSFYLGSELLVAAQPWLERQELLFLTYLVCASVVGARAWIHTYMEDVSSKNQNGGTFFRLLLLVDSVLNSAALLAAAIAVQIAATLSRSLSALAVTRIVGILTALVLSDFLVSTSNLSMQRLDISPSKVKR